MIRSLNDRYIKSVKPGSCRQEIADADTRGLYLVVQTTGSMSWAFRYRRGGKPAKTTLGSWPAMGLADARKAARDAKVALDRLDDPAAIRRAQLARVKAEVQPGDDSVTAWSNRYAVQFKAAGKRSWKDVERHVAMMQTSIGTKHISHVKGTDVRDMINKLRNDTPILANRVFSTTRQFFNWLVGEHQITISPCVGLKMPKENSRDRVLSWVEFSQIWRATYQIGTPFGPAIRMLMLTGQRRDEVASLPWSEISMARGEWKLPAERSKNKQDHMIPLSASAIIELKAMKPDNGPFVFTTNGKTSVSGFSKIKIRIDKMIETTEHWRLHDIRRTVATGLAEIQTPIHITEAILNHKSGAISGIAAVYNRHNYYHEKLIALQAWSRFVDFITDDGLRSIYETMQDRRVLINALNADDISWAHYIEKLRRVKRNAPLQAECTTE